MKKPPVKAKVPAKVKGGAGPPAAGKRGIARGHGKLTARGRTPAGRTSASSTLHAKGTASGHGAMKKPAPKKTPRKRQWSPGSDVACCSAEALGFLLGWDHSRILDLYWRTASDPDAGASIPDVLAAAELGPCLSASARARRVPSWGADACVCGFILGVSLPEPHAIAVTPGGTWWSWGEPFDPAAWPELVIEEAWCIPAL